MSKAKTIAAIKALPGMTARCIDGEYRVTMTDNALRALHPTMSAMERRQKAEDMAAYTDDAADAIGTAKAMAGLPITDAPGLPLSWRDESYGGLNCAHAFRLYDLEPRGLAGVAYRAAIERAGFEFHPRRCSWVAWEKGADLALCRELAKAGFTISAGEVRLSSEVEAETPETIAHRFATDPDYLPEGPQHIRAMGASPLIGKTAHDATRVITHSGEAFDIIRSECGRRTDGRRPDISGPLLGDDVRAFPRIDAAGNALRASTDVFGAPLHFTAYPGEEA